MGNIFSSHTTEYCGICLDKMKNSHRYQKFTCSHYFHKDCIDAWNQNCPICRNSILKIQNKQVDISGIRDMPNIVPPEYCDIYMRNWRKKECKKKNHTIIFRRPYGVLGACETCGYIQAFNLSHPVHLASSVHFAHHPVDSI